ncbi:hypothetical protein Q0F98_28770 [Paenibacillus amylolyticus]|nr:hypothetical protein Q0F98_28770 [Paenibacillus amylolyticus]
MSYERIKEIEKCFMKKNAQTPDAIKIARTHLLMIATEISEEDLKDAKIYYQSQLSSAGMIGNFLTIMAIAISLFACFISLFSSISNLKDPLIISLIVFFVLVIVAILVIAGMMTKQLSKSSRIITTYTIIINLIDEVIQK